MDVMPREDPRSLEERLQEPDTAASLHRLLDRLDAIEASLERLSEMSRQAPALVAMAGDTLDGVAQRAAASGTDINEHLSAALKLAERLTERKTAEQLSHLLSTAEQLPGLAALLADTVDSAVARANASGINLSERLNNLGGLAERLSRSASTEQLSDLLDLAEQAPNLVSVLADTLDGYARQAQANGLDLEQSLSNGLGAAARLGAHLTPERVRALEGLMVSLDDDTTRVAAAAGTALRESRRDQAEALTTFGLLRRLGDPDIRRALDFFTRFAKNFGKTLS